MKEQITIFYNKDKRHPNDYIVKRVLTQEGDYYTLVSYYMINNILKEFKSNLKWSNEKIYKYLLQCRKAEFFNNIEYQFMMEGI